MIKLRTLYRVAYGDGGFYELQTAIRVQGNAVEYIPVALLLLLVMEQNGAGVDGPCLRGYSDCRPAVSLLRVKTPREPLAAYGMAATFTAMILMVLANIWYLPWQQIFRRTCNRSRRDITLSAPGHLC